MVGSVVLRSAGFNASVTRDLRADAPRLEHIALEK